MFSYFFLIFFFFCSMATRKFKLRVFEYRSDKIWHQFYRNTLAALWGSNYRKTREAAEKQVRGLFQESRWKSCRWDLGGLYWDRCHWAEGAWSLRQLWKDLQTYTRITVYTLWFCIVRHVYKVFFKMTVNCMVLWCSNWVLETFMR